MNVSPKDMSAFESPVNVNLFGNRVSADIVKLK